MHIGDNVEWCAVFFGILLRKQKSPLKINGWKMTLPFGANFGLQGRTRPVQLFGGICKHIWACWYNFQKLHPHRCLDMLWLVVWNIFYVHPDPWENDPIWLYNIFQMGWFNHQLVLLRHEIILMVFSMCVVFFCKSFFVLRWFRWFLGYPCQPPNTSKSGWVLWPMKARWLSVSWWRITHTNTLKNLRVSVVVFRSEVICRVRV